jgi:hypothetical protein
MPEFGLDLLVMVGMTQAFVLEVLYHDSMFKDGSEAVRGKRRIDESDDIFGAGLVARSQ